MHGNYLFAVHCRSVCCPHVYCTDNCLMVLVLIVTFFSILFLPLLSTMLYVPSLSCPSSKIACWVRSPFTSLPWYISLPLSSVNLTSIALGNSLSALTITRVPVVITVALRVEAMASFFLFLSLAAGFAKEKNAVHMQRAVMINFFMISIFCVDTLFHYKGVPSAVAKLFY